MSSLESYALLREALVLLDGRSGRLLAERDLTLLQFDALRVLAEGEPLRMSELAFRILCDDSTLTRAVDHLVRSGWADRRRDSADRRALLVASTPEGEALYEAASEALAEELVDDWGSLSDDETTELQRILALLVDRLHGRDDDSPRAVG